MQINHTKSALQNLLDMIEAGNPNPVVVMDDQVTIGDPEVIDPATENGYDTRMTLTSIPSKGFTGPVTIRYHRAALPASVTPVVLTDTTSAGILEAIWVAHNIIPNEIAFVEDPVAPAEGEDKTTAVLVTTKAGGSFIYTPDEIIVEITWP